MKSEVSFITTYNVLATLLYLMPCIISKKFMELLLYWIKLIIRKVYTWFNYYLSIIELFQNMISKSVWTQIAIQEVKIWIHSKVLKRNAKIASNAKEYYMMPSLIQTVIIYAQKMQRRHLITISNLPCSKKEWLVKYS